VRALVGLGALIGITALLVWVWTQSVPLLVRPVFTWSPLIQPTPEAMFTTQENGGWIILVAVLATIGRGTAQLMLAQAGGTGPDRMTKLENRFRTDERIVPLLSRLPLVVRLILRALALTAILAGLYAAFWQALLTFAVLLFAQFITSPLLKFNFGAYARFIAKIPRFIRLLLAIIPVYLLGALIIPLFRYQESFLPFLLLAVLAAVLMSLLNPPSRDEVSK
jgi:hypothetical protein